MALVTEPPKHTAVQGRMNNLICKPNESSGVPLLATVVQSDGISLQNGI